jgi:hypothetical protein
MLTKEQSKMQHNLFTRINTVSLGYGVSPEELLDIVLANLERNLVTQEVEAPQVQPTQRRRRRKTWSDAAKKAQSERLKAFHAAKKAAQQPKKRGRKPGYRLNDEQKAALQAGRARYQARQKLARLAAA